MGYLLKKENGDILMFYSKPEEGYYRGNSVCFTEEEYNEYQADNSNELQNDFVWINGWYDASNGFTKEAYGVKVDTFVLDCILQGKELELNKPFEF